MGGGGQNTTTQKSDPWAGQQPYLTSLFAQAQQQQQGQGPLYFGTTSNPRAPTAPTRDQFTVAAKPGTWTGTTGNTGEHATGGGGSWGGATPASFNQAGFDSATAKYQQDLATYNAQIQPPTPNAAVGSPTLAPVSPQTQQAQQMAQTAATGTVQNLANTGAFASNYAMTQAIDPANNPFFQSAVAGAIRPAVQQFTDAGGALSQIRDSAMQAGQYGGTRQGIGEGIASSRLQQQVLDTAAGMGNVAYNEGLTAQQRALALLPQTQAAQYQPATGLDSVGQQMQAQQQTAINDAIAKWNYQQQLPQQQLSQFANLVNGSYGGSSTTTAPSPQGNPLMSGLGGAAAGAAIGTQIMPGYGTAVGAGLGALIGLFGSR